MEFIEIKTGKKVKANNYVEMFAFSHNSNYKKYEKNTDEKGKRNSNNKNKEVSEEIIDNEEIIENNQEEVNEEVSEEIGEVIQ